MNVFVNEVQRENNVDDYLGNDLNVDNSFGHDLSQHDIRSINVP